MLAFEREADQALVIAAGLPDEWLADNFDVVVKNLPTYYGRLSYTLRREGTGTLYVWLSGDLVMPPGGIVVKPPLPRPIVQVEMNGNTIGTFNAESVTIRQFPVEVVLK
jgi:hypothetical protein